MPSKAKPKASPILFSAPMIRALLDGAKTQTRRVVKPQPEMVTANSIEAWNGDPAVLLRLLNQSGRGCPYGQPGDLLWARETWGLWANDGLPQPVFYRADYPAPDDTVLPKWRPSIHMPRWASRLTLRITDVRVERVQDISEADVRAEGVSPLGVWCGAFTSEGVPVEEPTWREPFMLIWNSINAKRGFGWDANPWVWALTFEVIQANVDDVLTTPRTAP